MSIDLSGRVAIVTGAGRGLGRDHALALARHGAHVVVNELDPAAADAVVAEIAAAGGSALAAPGSVGDADTVAAMAAAAIARWGRIDALVCNAGILRDRSFAKMELDDFRAVMHVHVTGAFLCAKAVWEPMRAQGRGRIVFTTSSSGLFGNFGQANYGAAKMALVGLMQTLSIEGAKHDIRVNCLAPTAATAMTGDILPAATLERFAPALVSPGVVALCADEAPTRAILCAGGGSFAQAFVGLTAGRYVGDATEAAATITARWDQIGDRTDATVPAAGAMQFMQEVRALPPA